MYRTSSSEKYTAEPMDPSYYSEAGCAARNIPLMDCPCPEHKIRSPTGRCIVEGGVTHRRAQYLSRIQNSSLPHLRAIPSYKTLVNSAAREPLYPITSYASQRKSASRREIPIINHTINQISSYGSRRNSASNNSHIPRIHSIPRYVTRSSSNIRRQNTMMNSAKAFRNRQLSVQQPTNLNSSANENGSTGYNFSESTLPDEIYTNYNFSNQFHLPNEEKEIESGEEAEIEQGIGDRQQLHYLDNEVPDEESESEQEEEEEEQEQPAPQEQQLSQSNPNLFRRTLSGIGSFFRGTSAVGDQLSDQFPNHPEEDEEDYDSEEYYM